MGQPIADGELFWALEWNKSCRVFGGIFHPGPAPTAFGNLPSNNWVQMTSTDRNKIRARREIPIKENEDILFKSKVLTRKGA